MFTSQSCKEITHNQGRKDQLVVAGFACMLVCSPSRRRADRGSQNRTFSRGESAIPQRHSHAMSFSSSLFHDLPFAAFRCNCVSTDRALAG